MSLEIRQFACLSDNYGYLIRDQASGKTAAIDTPDAEAVLAALKEAGWGLDYIFNTHWHPDHAGGNDAVKAATGCEIVGPEEVTRIAPLDRVVQGGDTVALGETLFQVIDTKGHTAGHVSYYAPSAGAAFVGDTLFALGCGRLFEGTPQMMWESLNRLSALPPETQVYCAHEYTASNARFALSVDPSPELRARAEAVFAARERGEWTVPTSIAAERAANPFLRAPELAPGLGLSGASDVEAFAAVRKAKDEFKG